MGDDDEPPPLEDARAERARVLGAGRWPEVVADIGAGRGFAAHAKLLRIRRAARSGSERQTIDAVLADRRLFVERSDKAPGLGRFNGFGSGMYGRSAYDAADETYVKTRSVSGFWVPLFPIDQWLVRDAEGGGWYFLGRVPLDRTMRLARVVAMALVAVAIAVGVSVSLWMSSHADVHLVNGLDVAADVAIDDQPARRVESGARTVITVGAGKHHFRCTVGGRVVDDRDATVKGGADLVAYNVAGAAPLLVQDVVYFQKGRGDRDADKAAEPKYQLLAGTVFVQDTNVRYVFEEPPDEVNLPRGSDRARYRQALLSDGGWRNSVAIAEELGDTSKAADIAESVALAQADDDDVRNEAVGISKSLRSGEAHKQFLERLTAARTR